MTFFLENKKIRMSTNSCIDLSDDEAQTYQCREIKAKLPLEQQGE